MKKQVVSDSEITLPVKSTPSQGGSVIQRIHEHEWFYLCNDENFLRHCKCLESYVLCVIQPRDGILRAMWIKAEENV